MAMSSRTIYELHCDEPACSAVVSGPSHSDVMRYAFENANWETVSVAHGHGRAELLYRCPAHRGA